MKPWLKKSLFVFIPFAMIGGAFLLAGSSGDEDRSYLRPIGENLTKVSLDPPNDLNFSGEVVPMRDFEVKERLEQELVRYIYFHSATIMNIKRAARWQPVMTKILRENGIPEDFFYLCVAESHLANATSPVGAKGFWQFMEETGRTYGLEISKEVDERLDPVKSTVAATAYLKDAHRRFRNWTLVAASYNMGVGGVQGQLTKQKVSNYYDLYLNKETSAYVFKILALKTILEDPANYGFDLRKDQLYKPLRYKEIEVTESIDNLIDFAIERGTNYKMLKVMNPWILGEKLTISQGKSYRIALPLDANLPEGYESLIPGDSMEGDSAVVDSMPKPGPDKAKETKVPNKTDSNKTAPVPGKDKSATTPK